MKQFRKASKAQTSMKLSIAGPSGSGKTYSALLLAQGLVGDLSKVAVIDSENGSAHLYSELGEYSVLTLSAPFTPESYIEAIKLAEKEGFTCLIIDSLSHCWEGEGGILHIHSQMQGNSFANWSKLTPRHQALVQTIVQSPIHIIATMRSKQDYILNDRSGKAVPEKVGMKPVQRDGMDYEFSVAFELNMNHVAICSKDRTGIFRNQHEFKLSPAIGSELARWCRPNQQEPQPIEEVMHKAIVDEELSEGVRRMLNQNQNGNGVKH